MGSLHLTLSQPNTLINLLLQTAIIETTLSVPFSLFYSPVIALGGFNNLHE